MENILETLSNQKTKIEDNKNITLHEPFIPYKQNLYKIPRNLPEGTTYGINIINNNDDTKQTIGDRIEMLNSTLNNIIEILSFLVLRQVPELSKTTQENLNNILILLNKKVEEFENLEQQQIHIVERLSNIIDNQETDQDKEVTITKIKETLLKKPTLKIIPPIRIT